MRIFTNRPKLNTMPVRGVGKAWATKLSTTSRVAPRYAYFSGASGNYVSTGDSSALRITGDLELRVRAAPNDYTPTAIQALIAKDGVGPGTRSYVLYIDTDGTLVYGWSVLGTILITKSSTSAVGVADGNIKWLRVVHDVDNGAVGNDVKFYTADDNTNYVQLGSTVTTAGTTSIAETSAIATLGSAGAGVDNRFAGRIYEAEIYSGTTRVASWDANLTVVGALQSVGRHGEIWTVSGEAYIGT